MRHFEQLNRAETARVLGITEEAGANRYVRAITKLKTILAAMKGDSGGLSEQCRSPTPGSMS